MQLQEDQYHYQSIIASKTILWYMKNPFFSAQLS